MNWLALLLNAVLPAFAAFRYAQFALAPTQYDDDYAFSLCVLYLAQFPLCLLGAAFSGVSYIEGPSWRRVLIYLAVVAVFGGLSGFAALAYESELGPILAWAVAMQVVLLMFVGSQRELALKRIDAVSIDAVNLTILGVYAGLLAIAGALLFEHFAGDIRAWQAITFEWSDLAWVGAAYFALRAWSAAYVYTAPFEARGKGYFQRAWIEWLVRGKWSSSNDEK